MATRIDFNTLKTPVTWILRLLTGAVFIFSGFVKMIDPWGTLYKFQDYMAVWHLDLSANLLLVGVFALCIYEFLVGVFLATGSFRRSAPVMGLVLMAVMLPLTLWIAVADPVSDCGCFGDAVVISNWQTFWKNVAITAALAWLVVFNRLPGCIIRPSLQWMGLIASAAYMTVIGLLGYAYQPLLDFRPYPVGSTLYAQDDDEEEDESEDIMFVYSKDGEEKKFSIDDTLPSEDEGWVFVRREESAAPVESDVADPSADADSKSFRIWSVDGNDDVTEEALSGRTDRLLLLMPDLDKVSIATTWKINSLYSWAEAHDIDMVAVVSASPEEIERWDDLSLPAYPIYTAEDTEIKMLARGNPAIVYLNDGRIAWKSTLRALPNDDFLVEEASARPMEFSHDNKRILLNISGVYLALMAALAFLSYLPALGRFFRSRQ